ncbi:alpha/beta-hydrolase [Gautieria morchelliformis]|nr:alpha/beta-hydrolase [Gautieria morchelliformis]
MLLVTKFPRAALTNSILLRNRTLSNLSPQPLELQYERIESPTSGDPVGDPLVICHGLFGSKQNWRSLSKAFAARLHADIYSLDLRNHGSSPQAEVMDYTSMASDVLHFCRTHNLSNVSLLGHSMGGKVAMALALSPNLPPGLLARLIVADIAPSKGALSPEFRSYTDAMQRIEKSQITTRKAANDIIQEIESDPSIRAFLLTNLTSTHGGAPLKFRVPVDTIKRSIDVLGDFPYEPEDGNWNGSTLIIKGAKSRYLNRYNIPIAKQFFPRMHLETLDANHWVHAEKPHEFVDLVVKFIREV